MHKISRRRLISITANVISYTAVAHSLLPRIILADDEQIVDDPYSEVNLQTLAMLARDFFPHDGLSDEVYSDIARIIISQELSSTGNFEQIRDGISQLNNASKGREWRHLDEQPRLQILTEIESSQFFSFIYNRIKGMLYLRKEVWQIVGYGGNALQRGGYLNNGFDDIDWLD